MEALAEKTKPMHTGVGVGIAALGAVILAAWQLDLDILTRWLDGRVSMKPRTAIGFLLSGASVALISRRSLVAGAFAVMIAGWCLLLASIDLVACAVGHPIVIDPPSMHDSATVGTVAPGVPSIGTMLGFICHSLGVIVAASGALGVRCQRALFAMVAAIGAVALWGHLFNLPPLFFAVAGMSTGMAIPTALGMLILGTAGLPPCYCHYRNELK